MFGSIKHETPQYRDHFDVLIVFGDPLDLEAVRRVLENEIESAFVEPNDHIEVIDGLRVCRNWNNSPLTVALIAQSDVGGKACTMPLLERMTCLFDVDVVVMTGVCSGVDRVHGGVEYGTVVVTTSTSTEGGGEKQSDGEVLAHGDPEKMVEDVDVVIEQAIARLGGRSDWLETIPQSERRASPRYVEEMMLDEVMKSNYGVHTRDLFSRLKSEVIMKEMDERTLNSILEQMVNTKGWVSVEGGIVRCTARGEEYAQNAYEFPRADEINVLMGEVGSTCGVTVNYLEMKQYHKQIANRKLKGIDVEAYQFMSRCKDVFPHCVPLVMKGVSGYGTTDKRDYYQTYAALTGVAFLRHLLGLRQFCDL